MVDSVCSEGKGKWKANLRFRFLWKTQTFAAGQQGSCLGPGFQTEVDNSGEVEVVFEA